MEYVGHGDPGDDVVIRGSLHAREFIAFWHRRRRVTAAMNVNVWDVDDDLKAIVAAGGPTAARRPEASSPTRRLVPATDGEPR